MAEEKKKKEKKEVKPPEVNPDLYGLAVQIIEKYPDRFPSLTQENFTVVSIFGGAKKKYLGKCRAVRSPYSALLGEMCYIIEINEDRLAALEAYNDDDQKALKLLLYHELIHIHVEGCDPKSKKYRKIVKHDIEDFSECLSMAGNEGPYDWFNSNDIPDILE